MKLMVLFMQICQFSLLEAINMVPNALNCFAQEYSWTYNNLTKLQHNQKTLGTICEMTITFFFQETFCRKRILTIIL
jgi:hypothetical protein